MHISLQLEKVAIGSVYAHFRKNSYFWLRLCVFHLKSLQLAQGIRVLLEIVAIRSGCACSMEIVVLGLD